jgi:V8-like Glu-specific endopeptidase
MVRWLSALLALPLAASCALTSSEAEEPAETLEQPIAGGEIDVEHESVFATVAHRGEYGSFCTATLIAPNLLLTARHCVSDGGGETVICGESEFTATIPGENIYATNDTIPAEESPWYRGQDVRVPHEGSDTCGFDVALIILGSNVPAAIAAPAIPRIDLPVQQGESYIAVGYGNTSDVDESGGTRMNRGELEVQCSPGECPSSAIESTEFLGETGICSGDSGGPALDDEGKVVGVVSRGSVGCDTPIYGTVTAWRDWLMATAVEAAALGNYEPPYWATSGSSDIPVGPDPDPDPEPGSGSEGAACSQADVCGAGLTCHFDSDPSDAVCRESCTTSADCSGGLSCRTYANGDGVCLDADGSADEGGCAVSPRRSGPGAPWGSAALITLALTALFRRRR